jgi:exopolysaccharide biosynthesis polyprenyl glycosylphosphotransferase
LIKFRRYHTILFILFDYLSALIAWFTFFLYRKYFIEPEKFGYSIPFEVGQRFYLGLMYVPLYWLLIYWITGNYSDVWRKSRIKELSSGFTIILPGVLILFFTLLLDDEVASYNDYYMTIATLFLLHYGLTLFCRISLITYIKTLIRSKKIGFKTIMVGNNQTALDIYNEIKNERFPSGYMFAGYVTCDGKEGYLESAMTHLGIYKDLPGLIHQHNVEEVIIAIPSTNHNEIIQVTNILEDVKVMQKIIPDTFDMVSGSVRLENIVGTALIEVKHEVMPQWQLVLKRTIDILVAFVVLLLLSPLYLVVAIAVKQSSKGPVFFKQIRIGRYGKPFHIFKFRSMYVDAEQTGPALSSKGDKRITPVGLILRKYRLDEIPQFYNVLIGQMSLVGPRPERKFYIDQIIRVAPHYKQLQRVRPGITSWGMVKYGYAENVAQMVERLKFDILYIENMSIAVDFRIMIYTIKTILQGRGK